MPKYLIISYQKSDIKNSISAKFIDDHDLLETYLSWMMVMQYRLAIYEWYVPEDDNEMPYYKILFECFRLDQ